MSNEPRLPSDSDEDDDDYVPEGGVCEGVSEVESEGDAESSPEDENDENNAATDRGRGRKGRKGGKRKSKKRKNQPIVDKVEVEEEVRSSKAVLTEEEEKKRADSLWADFMKDTGTTSTTQKSIKSFNGPQPISPIVRPRIEEKVKITKIFEFAGEEVKIEKEVSIDSAEARLSLPADDKSPNDLDKSTNRSTGTTTVGRGNKRTGGLVGISSVLGQLGKKAKISTLEKSKLDWDSFKREENIDEEINTHNRGKDGYLERQDFLQRADVRQFEIEKQMRLSRRSNR